MDDRRITMNRREFLKRGVMAAGAAALPVPAVEFAIGGVVEGGTCFIGESPSDCVLPKAVAEELERKADLQIQRMANLWMAEELLLKNVSVVIPKRRTFAKHPVSVG